MAIVINRIFSECSFLQPLLFTFNNSINMGLLFDFNTDTHVDTCEEVEQAFVEVSGCTSMPYNLTTYPNVLGHPSQMAALDEGYTTLAVLEERCYEFMQVYWCITFTPPCVDGRMIPPCRQFCRSRYSCYMHIAVVGYTNWITIILMKRSNMSTITGLVPLGVLNYIL